MKGLRILLADDSADVRSCVGALLEGDGHTLKLASNGNEAKKLAQSERFDLALIDIIMPDGDGLEVIGALKKRQPGTRILAITGGGGYFKAPDCVKSALGLGAHAALVKPFGAEELRQGIERVMGPAAG
jgi:CheY-like chemotaxis protein